MVSSGLSKSGKHCAYSSSIKGSAWVNINIKYTVAGRSLPDMLDDTKFAAKEMLIAWFGDVGFFYQLWPDMEKKGGLQLRFHRVGSKQIDDVVVFEDKKNSEHTFAAPVSEDDQLLLLHVFKGGRSQKLWAAKITPEDLMASFRPEFNFDIIISDILEAEWRYVKFQRGKMLADEHSYVGNSSEVLLFPDGNASPSQLSVSCAQRRLCSGSARVRLSVAEVCSGLLTLFT